MELETQSMDQTRAHHGKGNQISSSQEISELLPTLHHVHAASSNHMLLPMETLEES
jgi:hypothetical protein